MKEKKIELPKDTEMCSDCQHTWKEHSKVKKHVGGGYPCKKKGCMCPEFTVSTTDHFKRTNKSRLQGMLQIAMKNAEYWKNKALEAAGTEGKNTNVFVGRFADKQRGLPRGTRVSFRMGGKKDQENIVDVYLEDGILWVHHATGPGDFYIRSHSSNLIQCHVMKGKLG